MAPSPESTPVANRLFWGSAADRGLADATPVAPFAEASLTQLGESWRGLGFTATLTLGHWATATILQSRFRRLANSLKRADLLVWAHTGPAFTHEGKIHLATWDTLPEDRISTSLELSTIFKPLLKKTEQVVLLIEAIPLPDSEPPDWGLLGNEFPELSLLSIAEAGQPCHFSPQLKARLGWHLLTEILLGRHPKALTEQHQLTVASLQAGLEAVMPTLVRRHLEPGQDQHSQQFGPGEVVMADLGETMAASPVGFLQPDRLARVSFRSESQSKVKELRDFRKSFQVPDSASASSQKFIGKLAQTDIREDLEDLQNVLRERLGLRRKEAEIEVEAGEGTLRTPHLDYTVSVRLSADDPSRVNWRRELSHFREASFLQCDEFRELFESRFDQLVFEFREPFDLTAWIDQLEDNRPAGVKLQVSGDAEACEIRLAGQKGLIQLTKQRLIIQGRGGLLDQLLAFLNQFRDVDQVRALPAARRRG